MRNLFRCLSILAVFFLVFAVACEGPEGPQGPAGPTGEDGDDGEDFVPFTFLGDNMDRCGHCHGATVFTWMETGHHEAYDALADNGSEDNPYCLSCHTTGWDSPVSFGDSVITEFGPDTDGFDDAWAAGDTERMDALEGVQCEACHGNMGPTIYDHEPEVSFATRMEGDVSLSTCDPCHHTFLEAWELSGHALAVEEWGDIDGYDEEFNSFSSCWECHTSEGFISVHDADHAGMERPEPASLIGCVTCHDPHDGTHDAQLRSEDDYTVLYDAHYAATFTGYGPAQVCVQCHHARRDVENVEEQIAEGDDHFGPHSSPQMDMFLGSGAYEIDGYDYESARSHFHQSISEACVTCHMVPTGEHEDPDHTLEASVEACTACHGTVTDFNINGFEDAIEQKMAALLDLLGVDEEDFGDADVTTPEQRMAAYAYKFVEYDGSHGIHNPAYAEQLLDHAIAFLGG
jgi:hypothetical protein